MVVRKMPRVQAVLFPTLRAELPGVQVVSWVPDVDYRQFPILEVRRLGGFGKDVSRLDKPTIEMTAYGTTDLPTTEDLYMDARQVIWDMVQNQTVEPDVGYLHSYLEVLGPTQFDSPFDDSWRVQGLIQLGVRPTRG